MALILIYQLSLPNTIILYFWVSCLSLFGRWCFIFLCTHIFLLSWKSIHFWIRTLMRSKIVTQLFRILSSQNYSRNSVLELFIIRLLTSNFPLSPLVCTIWLSKWKGINTSVLQVNLERNNKEILALYNKINTFSRNGPDRVQNEKKVQLVCTYTKLRNRRFYNHN